jgi:lysophospholipase L1-like esterase
MRIGRLLIAAVASFSLCISAWGEATDPNTPIDPGAYDHPVKVACVGDSITEGVGTSKHGATSWPADLQKMLGDKWNVGNFGSSGRTLLNKGDYPYQTKGKLTRALAFQPDVVVIMLGTNDTKPWNWGPHKQEFAGDYKDLIEKFKDLPTHPRIFICHPPFVPEQGNYGINEQAILEELPIVDQVASDEKVGTIDIFGATKDHPEIFPDRVHPNDAGAAMLARAVCHGLTGEAVLGAATTEPAK